MLGACARRPVALDTLAPRSAAYRPASATSSLAPLPAQLPGRMVAAKPAPVPNLAPAVTVYSPAEVVQDIYERAYQELNKMLDGRYPLSFKRAVFLTENAYLDNQVQYQNFCGLISQLTSVSRTMEAQSGPHLLYNGTDKAAVLKNAVLFRMMRDSTRFMSGRVQVPFRYDFTDFNGDADWRNMFVSKLLVTHKGNCHSLPFLYKIVAEETGAKAWLALAPNHIYLKQHDEKDGWYNTELTSHTFPNDAWLTASGYISRETIISGIYMDTLSAKQNVVLCLVDLAKGYERKVGRVASEAFVLKCTNLALQYFPNYINAQLLQAEALRQQFERQTTTADAQRSYAAMEAAYTRIFETGYREMPAPMYAEWLQLVQREKAKYQTQH
jgi:hypothetical protein